jgi:hypothetical protein
MKTNKRELNIQKKMYYKHIRLATIYRGLSKKIKLTDISELFHSFSYEHHRYAERIRATLTNNNQYLLLLVKIFHQIDSHWVGLSMFYLGNTFLKYYLKRKEKEIISIINLMSITDKNNTLFYEIEQCSQIHIENIDSFDRIK